MTLTQFFDRLDRFERRISLHELKELLGELDVSVDEVSRYLCFKDTGYQRNLLHEGSAYEALILCWKAGQRSAIHDHRGSSCGILVIRGTATETTFVRNAQDWIVPDGSFERRQGGVCGSNDMDTHQVSNLQAGGEDLITMHVYSPPLREVSNYSLTDNTVTSVVAPVNRTPDALASHVE